MGLPLLMTIIANLCVKVFSQERVAFWQREHGWSEGSTAPQCRPSASSWRTRGRWCPHRPWWSPSPPETGSCRRANIFPSREIKRDWNTMMRCLSWPCWTCRTSRWSSRCASGGPRTRWTSFLRFLKLLMHQRAAAACEKATCNIVQNVKNRTLPGLTDQWWVCCTPCTALRTARRNNPGSPSNKVSWANVSAKAKKCKFHFLIQEMLAVAGW